MNEKIEEYFVNQYIKKQYRERLLLELKDEKGAMPKRSYKAFKKFSHTASEYVMADKIAICSEKITKEDVIDFIKNNVNKPIAYYMDELGGREMPIFDCIEKAFDQYGAVIIVCDKNFAFIKEETSIGSPKKLILVNQ